MHSEINTEEKTLLANSQKGFTLLEIIMVIVILGILMSFLLGGVFTQADGARSKLNMTKMQKLKTQINLFQLQYNELPASLNSLVSCEGAKQGCVPLVQQDEISDPWGTPYRYSITNAGKTYQLKSLGSDRSDGGSGAAGDVTLDGPP
jgi:general secretion pathway protein G